MYPDPYKLQRHWGHGSAHRQQIATVIPEYGSLHGELRTSSVSLYVAAKCIAEEAIFQWIKQTNQSFQEIQTILAWPRRLKHPRRSKQPLDTTDVDLLISGDSDEGQNKPCIATTINQWFSSYNDAAC